MTGCSSVGRAGRLGRSGRRFEPGHPDQLIVTRHTHPRDGYPRSRRTAERDSHWWPGHKQARWMVRYADARGSCRESLTGPRPTHVTALPFRASHQGGMMRDRKTAWGGAVATYTRALTPLRTGAGGSPHRLSLSGCRPTSTALHSVPGRTSGPWGHGQWSMTCNTTKTRLPCAATIMKTHISWTPTSAAPARPVASNRQSRRLPTIPAGGFGCPPGLTHFTAAASDIAALLPVQLRRVSFGMPGGFLT